MKKSVLVIWICLLLCGCSEEKNDSEVNAVNVGETVIVSSDVPRMENDYVTEKPLKQLKYEVKDAYNEREIDNGKTYYSFGKASDEKVHFISEYNQTKFDKMQLNVLAYDNRTARRNLYLTFDSGSSDTGYLEDILDTLKKKNVKAAFFLTGPCVSNNPRLVKRIVDEGHIIGNHSNTHPNDGSLLDRVTLAKEILYVENYLRENYGYSSKYFRFPEGIFSDNALELVNSVGYRTVFWSVAYNDWNKNAQIGKEKAFEEVKSQLFPGAVILLHTISKDNSLILEDLIDYAVENEYTFRTLDEYGGWR